MTKELSIKSIKNELMDAFLGDMRIINSFSNKGEEKVKDYIGTNIFGYLNEHPICSCADTFINFDVMKNRGLYDVFINIEAHTNLFKKEAVNCLDDISECIEEIVNELYPYHISYFDSPVHASDNYYRRCIRFTLRPKDKDEYEKSLEDSEKENVNPWEKIFDWADRVTRCVEEWEHDKGRFSSYGNIGKGTFTVDNNGYIKVSDRLFSGTISDENKE